MAAERYQVFDSGSEVRLRAFYDRMVEPRPLRVSGKAEWLRRRGELRARVLAALGLAPMPERVPLEVRAGGSLDRDGYRVERLYWQTWPGVWAGGWLYTPAGVKGRLPAILNPHGHFEHGARSPTVQSRLISQALLGYIALAVDSAHVYDYPVGLTPASVMTYQNVRALDYLVSRADVDRERLGVTGASGGAQQAMYLLAVDDRPKAAVLAALVSYFRRILMPEGHHCPCNHVPGLARFTDETELCGIASPRALLFLTLTGDWTAAFPDQELGELRALYRAWLQEDRLGHVQFDGPHDYGREMREAAYAWFERELKGDRGAGRVPEPEHTVESPEALAALDRPPPEDRGEAGIRDWYRMRAVVQPPQLESRQARRNYQERVRGELLELLGGEPAPVTLETERAPARPARAGEGDPAGPAVLISFRSERDVRIPAVWLPGPEGAPAPAVVALHPGGKEAALRSPLVRELRRAGCAVLALDVRFRGELKREWLYNCILWGRPEAGMAAHDARTAVTWLLEQESVDPRAVVLLGEGELGMAALLAAGLDERAAGAAVDCCGATYRDGGEGLPVIPNILRVADVPQVASLVAPRPLWLFRVPAERVGFSSRRYYDWTRRSYQSLGEPDSLKMTTGDPDPAAGAEWLRQRIRRARRRTG